MKIFMGNCYAPFTVLTAALHPSSLSRFCWARLFNETVATSSSIPRYLLFYFLTCFLEAPLYYFLLRLFSPLMAKEKTSSFVGKLLLLNLTTHPLVFWGFPALFAYYQLPRYATLLASEIFAPAVEAILLRNFWPDLSWPKSTITAILANLFSWWIGLCVISIILKFKFIW